VTDAATNHTPQATGQGLLDFLDYAMQKGYLKLPTGQAMKTACKEVLSASEGDDWPQVDLSSLDVEDNLRRFETLRAMKFSSGSLNTYKGRFRKSVTMFEEFRRNPGGWRPDVKQRSRTARTASPEDGLGVAGSPATQSLSAGFAVQSAGSVITYPFPLRGDVLVSLQLPSDLTRREAKRLCGFIDSLAVDEQPALPAGDA
jgi:hypothetical protein